MNQENLFHDPDDCPRLRSLVIEYKTLETPFGRLGVLLCYEDSLPKMAKKAVHAGAEILIALSNPGHFQSTPMPYYHLMQDRFRAIETRRWVVRASANGYSAFVDPYGRFIQKSELGQQKILFGRAELLSKRSGVN